MQPQFNCFRVNRTEDTQKRIAFDKILDYIQCGFFLYARVLADSLDTDQSNGKKIHRNYSVAKHADAKEREMRGKISV